jgi:hypothetical protein
MLQPDPGSLCNYLRTSAIQGWVRTYMRFTPLRNMQPTLNVTKIIMGKNIYEIYSIEKFAYFSKIVENKHISLLQTTSKNRPTEKDTSRAPQTNMVNWS